MSSYKTRMREEYRQAFSQYSKEEVILRAISRILDLENRVKSLERRLDKIERISSKAKV